MTYEAGLQALDPRNFSGPLWEQLTGIKSNVVELSHPDQYSKPIAEHIAGSGAYDILDIEPAWTPSMADGGVIAPSTTSSPSIINKADLRDYHPLYKALPTYKGKVWGFFDDGDMFALYYRKDIFEDPKMKTAYQAKFSKALGRPRPGRIIPRLRSSSPTRWRPTSMAPRISARRAAPGNQYDFLQQFRANSGVFFDGAMKAQLASAAGIKTLREHGRRQQGVDSRQQRTRRRVGVGRLAAGQGGDDLFLAADRPHERQLFAERQSDQLRPAIVDRRQGGLCGRARQSASMRRDITRRFGRFRQCGGRLSVHAMGDLAAGLARPVHAALLVARSISAVALQVADSIARSGRTRKPISPISTIPPTTACST